MTRLTGLSKIVFLDCETTGLDPSRHHIWELSYLRGEDEVDQAITQCFKVPLDTADPFALEVGHWWERHSDSPLGPTRVGPGNTSVEWGRYLALQISAALRGRHIVGAVPSFDEAFLRAQFGRLGIPCTWHYQLVDVETLIAGRRGVEPPWNSNQLSTLVGINPADYERHTALGDVLWARALYLAAME